MRLDLLTLSANVAIVPDNASSPSSTLSTKKGSIPGLVKFGASPRKAVVKRSFNSKSKLFRRTSRSTMISRRSRNRWSSSNEEHYLSTTEQQNHTFDQSLAPSCSINNRGLVRDLGT